MVYGNIERLKDNLEQIKFGILKTAGSTLLKLSNSFIIETCKVDHNGDLWCTSSVLLPSDLSHRKDFAAQLKYVNKAEGLFIKISGHATLMDVNSPEVHEIQELVNAKPRKNSLLKIKIEEVQYYKKKSVSAYTSFLQAVNIFTLNNAIG
jgi:general stress protein 26